MHNAGGGLLTQKKAKKNEHGLLCFLIFISLKADIRNDAMTDAFIMLSEEHVSLARALEKDLHRKKN